MALACPQCACRGDEGELKVIEGKDYDVYACPRCGGRWIP